MYTENASRSAGDGVITPENMEPNPKNTIIDLFFEILVGQIDLDQESEIYLSIGNIIRDKNQSLLKVMFLESLFH